MIYHLLCAKTLQRRLNITTENTYASIMQFLRKNQRRNEDFLCRLLENIYMAILLSINLMYKVRLLFYYTYFYDHFTNSFIGYMLLFTILGMIIALSKFHLKTYIFFYKTYMEIFIVIFVLNILFLMVTPYYFNGNLFNLPKKESIMVLQLYLMFLSF